MKIRRLEAEDYPRVIALLRKAFPGRRYEVNLVENLHKNGRTMHEWTCIHRTKIVGYIGFTTAYNTTEACGLHLAPLAVTPTMRGRGVGSELLRFALRQEIIRSETIFVLGDPGYYQKFGFEPCAVPVCPFDTENKHFLSIRNKCEDRFIVGYEPEFKIGV